jgi:hypothetical protein
VQPETLIRLRNSKRFLRWQLYARPKRKWDGLKLSMKEAPAETYYSPADVAEQWGVSVDLIRDTFRDEPGVLKFKRPGSRVKRSYSTIRIPQSVLLRVHRKLTE